MTEQEPRGITSAEFTELAGAATMDEALKKVVRTDVGLFSQLPTMKERLRAPLPAQAIKPHPTKSWMSSINGAFIVERLNDVFGEDGWSARYEIVENNPQQKMVVVKAIFEAEMKVIQSSDDAALLVRHRVTGKIYRECFGGNDNPDRGDAYKGACTDALGKIASQLGIAGEVYKGMLDEVQAPAETDQRQSRKPAEAKRQYENIDGIVTRCERHSPESLWLQVNNVKIHCDVKALCDQLDNCMGKKLEATAYWATAGKSKTPILRLNAVMGVYSAVPRDPEYVKEKEPKGAAGVF